MTAYDSLVKVLSLIESRRFDMLRMDSLAREAYLSPSHLQRVFRLTCGQSFMHYVRGRKLAYSLDELFNSDMRIIDIAVHYGFRHEQSYIRAFNKEYGCTPGEARETKKILPIRARIAPEDLRNVGQGLLYGPKTVQMPPIELIGKPFLFCNFDMERDALEPNRAGLSFAKDAREHIPDILFPDVYTAVSQLKDEPPGLVYIPCAQVKRIAKVPEGYAGFKIPPLRCVLFHYVGNHHYEDISMTTARELYAARRRFFENQKRYVNNADIPGLGRMRHFERIDTRLYDGVFCQMDLIVPVTDTLCKE